MRYLRFPEVFLMNENYSMKSILVMFFLVISTISVPGIAGRYDEPALQSVLAEKSYLLDVGTSGKLTALVGERGHILFRNEGDLSWQQAEVPTRTNLNAISMSTRYGNWVVGHDSLVIKSDDDITKWVLAIPREDLLKIALNEIDAQRSGNKVSSEMEESVDFLYEELLAGIETGVGNNLFDIAINSNGRGLMVGAFGLAFSTSDGGESWRFIGSYLENSNSLHLYASLITDDGKMFIVGESGLIFYSEDSVNWVKVEQAYQGTLLDILASDVSDEIYIVGMGGKLLKSVDSGQNWALIQLPSKFIIQSACLSEDGAIYLAGLGGYIYRFQNNKAKRLPFLGKQNLAATVCKSDPILAVGEGGIHLVDTGEIYTTTRLQD